MKFNMKYWKFPAVFVFSLFLLPGVTQAQHYKQTNLVSNIAGMAPVQDPNLKNPWGLTRSSGSPWWVGNNNSGTSTLYTGTGAIIPINGTGTVTVPPPNGSPAGTQATPTGVVFNGSPIDFLVAPGKSAHFIFATEDGTISGWNGGQNAVLLVDNSDNGSSNGAVYKGATSGEINGNKFLYVTNFRSAKVEVYDTNFKRVHLGEDAFNAEEIPRGFAPFNIQNIGGTLFVTYAKQDAARHDDVAGDGLGFAEIYTPTGKHIGRLQHGTWFNAPWGVVWTTRDFGEFSNAILVGNFGSGWIAAFNGFTYKFIGFLKNPDDSLVTIDGLWSLTFGNDGGAGPANTLFFTAGINNEQDGLFGTLTPTDGLDGDEE
ncbi:MAG TPA: TIGR03118 family protein [Candidatus Limnocylindria bacterium]|nr:TIGR03118 family protein [Candidatus Limnocylindria bacterium]